MKKTNKKGFTIVELVIVIAVIAILAAVLIPTFAGVVEKANKNADLQAARNAFTNYYTALSAKDLETLDSQVLVYTGKYGYKFVICNGGVETDGTTKEVKYYNASETVAESTALAKVETTEGQTKELSTTAVANLQIVKVTTTPPVTP